MEYFVAGKIRLGVVRFGLVEFDVDEVPCGDVYCGESAQGVTVSAAQEIRRQRFDNLGGCGALR